MTRVAVRALVGAALVALLAPPPVASAEMLSVDVNGDGRTDRVVLEPSSHDVLIQFSGPHQTFALLHSRSSVLRIVAADVDRDGDIDLIASTTSSGLRFWINNGRGRFSKRTLARHHFRWSHTTAARFGASDGEDTDVEIQASPSVVVQQSTRPYAARARPPTGPRRSPGHLPRPAARPGLLRGPPASLLV